MFARALLLCACGGGYLSAADDADTLRAATEKISQLIRHDLSQRRIPCLSITIVDDRGPIWSAGFSQTHNSRPFTGATVYRVTPVSQLLTNLAILRLAEQGKLHLHAPVAESLLQVLPTNAWTKPITLRHLMNHRSGLCRQVPIDLHDLYSTQIAFEPGTQTKTSFAGAAVAARRAEVAAGNPLSKLLQEEVLGRAGLKETQVAGMHPDVAAGQSWTVAGREIAVRLNHRDGVLTTSDDLGRLLTALLAGRLLSPNCLRIMCTPEEQHPGQVSLGVGVRIARYDGQRQFAWGATGDGVTVEWLGLPDARLGVVVVAGRDHVDVTTGRIARQAARLLLAARDGRPMPRVDFCTVVGADEAGLAGVYGVGDGSRPALRITQVGPRTWAWAFVGGRPYEIVRSQDGLCVEFSTDVMPQLRPDGPDRVRIGQTIYKRLPDTGPPPEIALWSDFIGEYVNGTDRATVFEDAGRLYVLMDDIYAYPLTVDSPEACRFPNYGLYAGEPVSFDRMGKEVRIGGILYRRDPMLRHDSTAFRIEPRRPVAELMKDALAAMPPADKGEFAHSDLVDLATLDPGVRFDIRYATTNNFLGVQVYPTARAFLQRPAAEALLRAHRALAADGLGLLIHDAYRPWHITKVFWDATPPEQHNFVADPAQGSRHNRGCAVDLTLYALASGTAVTMPGGYDEFSDRSYPEYPGGTSRQRWYRDRLRRVMTEQGFTVYEAEWWHFDYRDWKKYAVLNVPFERVGQP